MTSTLSAFQGSGARDADLVEIISPETRAMAQELKSLIAHVMAVDASLAGKHRSLAELIAQAGQHEHRYRCLVVHDYPNLWTEEMCADLHRLLKQGAKRGVSIILHHNPDERSQHPRPLPSLPTFDTTLSAHRSGWTYRAEGTSFDIHHLKGPGPDVIGELMAETTARARKGALPKVPLEQVVPPHEYGPSTDGMQVDLGLTGMQKVGFTLGDSSQNLHNVLIGGAVGTGKTNLLKTFVYSLCSGYGPDELRLFLLDFKEGVEFQQFLASGSRPALPHASVVSIQSDVAFGLATLRHFADEIERRAEIFRQAGVPDLARYRARTGAVLPRWVLVADEFQVLFEGDTNIEATELLETLARKGRAYGLHVVLASQTLTGIKFAGGKENAIFMQFPARIVLKMPPSESQIFLGAGNSETARLQYRGQAVLNLNTGDPDANQRFVVALAEDEYIDSVQTALARKWPSAEAPRVYRGREAVSFQQLARSAARPTAERQQLWVPAWIGQECTVSADVVAARLGRRTSANLAVIGGDVETAVTTVMASTLTAVAAGPPMGG